MRAMRRALVISAKVGAGHMRAAEAVLAAIQETRPEIDVRHIEALEYTTPSFRKSLIGTYNQLVKRLPSLWGFLYERLEKKPADSATQRLTAVLDRMNATRLRKAVVDMAPDVILCTHYLPVEVFAALRRRGKLDAPLCVALTDFDIHTMWMQRGVDRYFVAHDEMAYALRAKGIGEAAVSVTGIPIMPEFSREYPDRVEMRRRLGLPHEPRTVLMAAGGFGLMKVDRLVSALAEEVDEAQFLVIAGRNEKLEKALRAVAAVHPGKVTPYGFVTNMHALMAASDVMVTKCGGLTSSECLAMGLPMVIVDPIPGQEERNADYLLEHGAAVKANSAAHMLFKVRKLLGDRVRLDHMRKAAKAVARPRAAYAIAEAMTKDE